VEKFMVILLRNRAWGNLKVVKNGIVEVAVAEINVGFVPGAQAGQGNAKLK
jgi:hypothetical protein